MVQFIGACTRKPNLCIVFEYMSGGSVYDYIRREGPLKLSQVRTLHFRVRLAAALSGRTGHAELVQGRIVHALVVKGVRDVQQADSL